jgi:hypothetical protein
MFQFPANTIVNKNIPKNAFDDYTNSKQKKVLTNTINKIRWLNKLSSQTINLDGKEVREIQIIEITLKQKESIPEITNVIDRAIPYHIIFLIRFENEIKLSSSQKHIHPTNENQAVVDWSFTSEWHNNEAFPYKLNLQQNLDYVYADICFQISGNRSTSNLDIKGLIAEDQQKKQLTAQIQQLEATIKACKQFNKKVEQNLELRKYRLDLSKIHH